MSATDRTIYTELKPRAVPIRDARKLLGNKARSEVYREVGRGNLDAVKDGNKTLITLASIERYMASLPPAKIGSQKSELPGRRRQTNAVSE